MQISKNSSQGVCALTTRQIREAVPESKALLDSLDKDLKARDVDELQSSLWFRSRKDIRPLTMVDFGAVANTCLGLAGMAGGTALALSGALQGALGPSLLFAVPLTLAGGAVVAKEYFFKRDCEQAESQLNQLNQFAEKAVDALGGPGPTPETYRNGNLWADGVFSRPQEVRRKSDGHVLERSIELKTPNPVKLTEDTTNGTVTITTRSGTFSALGSLELPTKQSHSITVKSPQVSQAVHLDGNSFAWAKNGLGGLVGTTGVHQFTSNGHPTEHQTNWESGMFHISPRVSGQPSTVLNPFIHGKELDPHFVSYLPEGSKATPISGKVFSISHSAASGQTLARGEALLQKDSDGGKTQQLYFKGGRFNLRQDLASERLAIQGPDGVEQSCSGKLLESGVVQLERPDGVLTQQLPDDGLALDFQTSQGRVSIRRDFQGGSPAGRLHYGDDDRGPVEVTKKGDDYSFSLNSKPYTLTPPVPEKVLETAFRATTQEAK